MFSNTENLRSKVGTLRAVTSQFGNHGHPDGGEGRLIVLRMHALDPIQPFSGSRIFRYDDLVESVCAVVWPDSFQLREQVNLANCSSLPARGLESGHERRDRRIQPVTTFKHPMCMCGKASGDGGTSGAAHRIVSECAGESGSSSPQPLYVWQRNDTFESVFDPC